MVVEGEVGVREGVRAGRARGKVFDERAEAVAEPAEPAAADRRFTARSGQRLQTRERVLARRQQLPRGRTDDRSAARPPAGQGERVRLAAQREQDPLGRESAIQFDDQTVVSVAEGLRRRPEIRGLSSLSRRRVRSPTPPLAHDRGQSTRSDTRENCAFRRESHEHGTFS
jgi:hypothetical protein